MSFVSLVNEMRQAQREYFRTRSSTALEKSKSLEKEVDWEVQQLLDNQKKLPFPFSIEEDP
jgi:hypothetical protein